MVDLFPFLTFSFSLVLDNQSEVDITTEGPAPTPVTQPPRNTQKQRGGGPAARGGKYYARGGKTQAPKEPTTAEDPVTENQRKCSRISILSFLS